MNAVVVGWWLSACPRQLAVEDGYDLTAVVGEPVETVSDRTPAPTKDYCG